MPTSSNNQPLERIGHDSELWASLVDAEAEASARPSSSVSNANMPERSPSPIPVVNRGIYSESHPLIPADLMTGPPTHGNLADQPPDIESTEKNVRRFLAVVQEIEPVLNGLALVRTLWRVECLCSTKGCEGSGRLRAGQLVQIRHHVSGRFQGRTFIECAAEECSRATSLAGSRAPSSPPSRDSEGVKVP